MGRIIGIDIGGTWFRIGWVDGQNRVSDFRRVSVRQVFAGGDPLEELEQYLRGFMAGERPRAIAIGFPATLDARRRKVLQAPNVAFLEDLPVVEALQARLGVKVFIERDVNLALIYDCAAKGIPAEGIVCGFYFGTGIGNAIMIEGVPLTGCHGTAGELGHIPAEGSETPCGCGNTGCMEPLAGGRYLRDTFPGEDLSSLFRRRWGDERLRRFVDRMAMTVATEINILDPHRILIGGGVCAMEGFPRDYLLERIRHYARKPLPAGDLRVTFVPDTEDKAVLGAAMYARSKGEKL